MNPGSSTSIEQILPDDAQPRSWHRKNLAAQIGLGRLTEPKMPSSCEVAYPLRHCREQEKCCVCGFHHSPHSMETWRSPFLGQSTKPVIHISQVPWTGCWPASHLHSTGNRELGWPHVEEETETESWLRPECHNKSQTGLQAPLNNHPPI